MQSQDKHHDDKGHHQAQKKIDPYWLNGKWVGEGETKDGGKYWETSTFKVISTDPEPVMQYQQRIQNSDHNDKGSGESGFFRFNHGHDDIMHLQSDFLHDFGLRELSFGHMGFENHHPFMKMHAKEDVHFHRPAGSLDKEKSQKGGEVTHYQRKYWLDDEGKLNYETMVGLDGKALEHQRSGKLTKAIE